MRLSLLVILLIFTNSIFAKSEYKKDVDNLLESSNNTFIKLEYIESLKLAREALHISTETNYAKGVTYSQLYIARVLQDVGLKMDALKYLKKIENEKYYHKDAFIQAEIYRIKGRIASSERLYSLEKEY